MVRLPECSAIILDKDGTITDSHIYWGYIIEARAKALVSQCIHTKDVDALSMKLEVCMGWDRSLQKLLPQGPIALKSRSEVIYALATYLDRIGQGLDEDQISDLFDGVQIEVRDRLSEYVRPLPGALEFMKTAHNAGIQLCLVTSDKTVNAANAMRICGVQDYLSCIIGGDLGYGDKSMGGPALHACRELGKHSREVVCIGDAKMDWDMHHNANLRDCILVSTGQTPPEELGKLGVHVVPSLDKINL